MAKRLFAASTDDWRASPKTASELVWIPTLNFTITTMMLATRMPPRTRRTPDDFSRESTTLGMVEVGKSRVESLESWLRPPAGRHLSGTPSREWSRLQDGPSPGRAP